MQRASFLSFTRSFYFSLTGLFFLSLALAACGPSAADSDGLLRKGNRELLHHALDAVDRHLLDALVRIPTTRLGSPDIRFRVREPRSVVP